MTYEAVNAYKTSSKGRIHIDLNAVAKAMDMLSKIRKRPDGYPLEMVRAVKAAILNDTDHPLKACILNIISNGRLVEDGEETNKKKSKEEIESRIKEYQKHIQEEQQRQVFENMRGRKPKSCDTEYIGKWSEKQDLDMSLIPSNAILFG